MTGLGVERVPLAGRNGVLEEVELLALGAELFDQPVSATARLGIGLPESSAPLGLEFWQIGGCGFDGWNRRRGEWRGG